MYPLLGSRVKVGTRWATVAAVWGDMVSLVFEGEATMVQMPKAACTAGGMATVEDRVRAVQMRRELVEAQGRLPLSPVRSDPPKPIFFVRRSTERRPTLRRCATAAAQRDGPLPQAEDEPPLDLTRVRGFLAANSRMHEHLVRRTAARSAA